MWDDDWQRLGLAPTADLMALKKAYAQRLRHTRPDDDAQAYQALRESYERLLGWQRAMAQQPAPVQELLPGSIPEPTAEPEPPPACAPGGADKLAHAPVPAPAPAPDPAPFAHAEPPDRVPAPVVTPAALIAQLEQAWARGGEPGALAAWEAVQAQLQELPLGAAPVFSAAFAQWLLQRPQLPDALAQRLEAHFAWLRDFRAAAVLGPGLMLALAEHLPSRLPPPPPSAELLEFGEPLMQIQQRLHHSQPRKGLSGWWGRLQAWLTQWQLGLALAPLLGRRIALLRPADLRQLGLFGASLVALRDQVTRWQVGRLAVLSLGLLGFARLTAVPDSAGVLALLALGAPLGAVILGLGVVLAMVLHSMIAGWNRGRVWSLRLQAWRARPGSAWFGLGCLALALAWAVIDPLQAVRTGRGPLDELTFRALLADWLHPLALWLPSLAGLLLLWPAAFERGLVLAGAGLFWCGLFVMAWHEELGVFGACLPGLLWMMLAALAFEGRLAVRGPLLWPLRPLLNAMGIGQRWGYLTVMAPVLLTVAVALLPTHPLSVAGAFVLWQLSMLVLIHVQDRLERHALQRMARQAPV